MDYTNIVQLLRSDPELGVTAVLDQCGDALYDYSFVLLGDHARATETLHDVLLVAAAKCRELRRPADLERWLYALVRSQAVRGQPADGEAPPDTGPRQESRWRPVNELDAAVMAFDVRAPGLLDLVLRHGFGPADVAAVCGVSSRRGHELVARARGLAANDCAASPFFQLPATLRPRVRASLAAPELMAAAVERAGEFDRSGFPLPLDRRRYPRLLLVSAAAVTVLVLATGAGVILTNGTDARLSQRSGGIPPVPGGGPASLDVDQSRPAQSIGPVVVPSGSPSPGNSASASPPLGSPRSTPPHKPPGPKPTATGEPSAQLVVTTTVTKSGNGCGLTWKAKMVAELDGATASQFTVMWWWPGESRHTISGAPGGSGRFQAETSGLPYNLPVSFKSTAVTADGRRGESATVTKTLLICKGKASDLVPSALRLVGEATSPIHGRRLHPPG
jgi:DNA-directed RNA polymerase specialized sigma24 family protein